MCTSVQTTVTQRYQQKQSERGDEKDKFYIYMFFVNGKRILLVAFIRYNCKFYCFLETKMCLMKKIVQYLLRFINLFCPKITKNDSKKSFIKKFLDSILYVQSFSVNNIPSYFCDLILA